MELMNKQCKVHPQTLKKINNQLSNCHNTINTTNTTNNTNSNNVTTNNTINLISIGHENLPELLSKKEKLNVLDHRYNSLNYLIKYIHFNNKYPQFRNIKITNTQNTIGYKYDSKEKKFIAIDKDVLLEDLILERMGDIEDFYEELNEDDDMKELTKTVIEKFIKNMDESDSYKEKKKDEIKLIIYNNKEMVKD